MVSLSKFNLLCLVPTRHLLEMHELRPDDDDQREGEGRPDDAQRRVLGEVVGDLLGPLAGPVVVQSRRVEAVRRRREVDGREVRPCEGLRRRPRAQRRVPSTWYASNRDCARGDPPKLAVV